MSGRVLVAAFDAPERAIEAAREARAAGYRVVDILSPFSLAEVEGIDDVAGRPSPVRPVMLLGALAGAAAMFALQTWSAVFDYPINSGGRALFSWPAFMLATFELAVLGAAIAGLVTMLVSGGLPRLHHPQFALAGIEAATQDRFFVLLADDGERLDAAGAAVLLARFDPLFVREDGS